MSFTRKSDSFANQLCNYNACLEFPNYLRATAEQEGRIYTVALFGFLEHKKLMGWRFEYITGMRGLNLTKFSQCKAYTKEITERIMLLGKKFQHSGRLDIINRMASMMDELLAQEKDMIIKIVYGE